MMLGDSRTQEMVSVRDQGPRRGRGAGWDQLWWDPASPQSPSESVHRVHLELRWDLSLLQHTAWGLGLQPDPGRSVALLNTATLAPEPLWAALPLQPHVSPDGVVATGRGHWETVVT